MGRGMAAIATVVLLVCSGCHLSRHREGVVTPPPTVRVGLGLGSELPSEEPRATQRRETSGFALLLSDEHGGHPGGVRVQVTGPVSKVVTSGADGYVRATAPPGFYHFSVLEGCQDDVIVQKGGTGKAGVVEGSTTQGTLLLLWQHRFGPGPPVYNDATGDWPRGKPVDFSFAVQDHCRQSTAPNRAIPTFAFKLSPTIKLAKPPSLKSDAKGRSHVVVSCVSSGDIRLDVYDKTNPSDSLDLMQLAIGVDAVPRCA